MDIPANGVIKINEKYWLGIETRQIVLYKAAKNPKGKKVTVKPLYLRDFTQVAAEICRQTLADAADRSETLEDLVENYSKDIAELKEVLSVPFERLHLDISKVLKEGVEAVE